MISRRILCFFAFLLLNCLALAPPKPFSLMNRSELDDLAKRLIRVGNKTYYIETDAELNWFDARDYCKHFGMELATINNADENNAIKEHLTNNSLGNVTYYTGGNDLAKKQEFVWDSTGEKFTFTDWLPGQPDNAVFSGEVEHCVHIMYMSSLQWNDIRCSLSINFLCEF